MAVLSQSQWVTRLSNWTHLLPESQGYVWLNTHLPSQAALSALQTQKSCTQLESQVWYIEIRCQLHPAAKSTRDEPWHCSSNSDQLGHTWVQQTSRQPFLYQEMAGAKNLVHTYTKSYTQHPDTSGHCLLHSDCPKHQPMQLTTHFWWRGMNYSRDSLWQHFNNWKFN